MSDVRVIRGPTRDLGSLTVRRVLPAPFLRTVGPFLFLDHMGPMTFPSGQGIDVRPHPHIGLATVTYLFDGAILHRDSLGTVQSIEPGAINWMVAGRGIVHSERTAPDHRATGSTVDGLQAWIGLPRAHEEDEPSFVHHPAPSLPVVTAPGLRLRVLAGAAYGVGAPVAILSELFYVDAALDAGAELEVPREPRERGVYIAAGRIRHRDEVHEVGSMLVLPAGTTEVITAETPARVALLGGEPLDGERHVYWNLVSSSRARVEEAARAWREERFPLVPGDEHERIPLPDPPPGTPPPRAEVGS